MKLHLNKKSRIIIIIEFNLSSVYLIHHTQGNEFKYFEEM